MPNLEDAAFLRPFRTPIHGAWIPRAAFVAFLLRSSSYGGHALALGFVVSALQAGGPVCRGRPRRLRPKPGLEARRNPARRWPHPGPRRFLTHPKGLENNRCLQKPWLSGRENCVHEHPIRQRTGCDKALFAPQSASLSNILLICAFPLARPRFTRQFPIIPNYSQLFPIIRPPFSPATPFSPPSDPPQRLLQRPPVRSKSANRTAEQCNK